MTRFGNVESFFNDNFFKKTRSNTAASIEKMKESNDIFLGVPESQYEPNFTNGWALAGRTGYPSSETSQEQPPKPQSTMSSVTSSSTSKTPISTSSRPTKLMTSTTEGQDLSHPGSFTSFGISEDDFELGSDHRLMAQQNPATDGKN